MVHFLQIDEPVLTHYYPGLLLGSYRELKEAHAAELTELKNNYKAVLEAEKLASQEKLGTFRTKKNNYGEEDGG